MNVVLDTNVLVSALMTQGGHCAVILDLAIDGALNLCVDNGILAEYRRVCRHPRLRLDEDLAQTVLDFIRDTAERVVPFPSAVELPDPDDRLFLDVARHAEAVLVTGNSKHFPPDARGTAVVMSPREFIEKLRKRPLEGR